MWIQNFVEFVRDSSSQPSSTQTSSKILAVTGYWDLQGKSRGLDTHTKFMKSFRHTTVFNADYAVYGEDSVVSSIQRIRSQNSTLQQNHRQTHGRILPFDAMVRLCESSFGSDVMENISQTSLSDRTHCPSAELVLVWLSKVLLVREAIQNFPNYTHFGWIDAGFKGGIDDVTRKWPADSMDSIQGLYVRRIANSCKKEFWRAEGKKRPRCPIGGMWFGDKKSVLEFIEHTIAIVRENLLAGKTVCADQDIFELALQRMKSIVHDTNGHTYQAIFV
jgi:hypothetical protein